MTSRTPDLIEPLRVYRYFGLSSSYGLSSLAYAHPWQGGWNAAACARRLGPEDPMPIPAGAVGKVSPDDIVHGRTPAAYCSCGFHAYYHPGLVYHPADFLSGEAPRHWPHCLYDEQFVAAVEVKGKTELHETGLRAQYMRVLAVATFNPGSAMLLSRHMDRYPSPGVRLLPSPPSLMEAYPPPDHSALVGADVAPWEMQDVFPRPPLFGSLTLTSPMGRLYPRPFWLRPGI